MNVESLIKVYSKKFPATAFHFIFLLIYPIMTAFALHYSNGFPQFLLKCYEFFFNIHD